ncbi:TonB-dependent receptor [Panacibacter ginsenosidivorans]|nr:TonB-dependent receptor [Panacibacter ginsenosidivorans]
MNKRLLNGTKPYVFITCFVMLLLFSSQLSAQTVAISGKVTNQKGEPLAGASVLIKGTNNGTKTDDQGKFSFTGLTSTNVTVIISYVGYNDKEIKISAGKSSVLNISLEEKSNDNEEIIVTGVFDKRKKMEASVAITTINSTQISKLVSASAADLLKNVSGVYVNSALGEIRNTVYSRGVSVGSNDGASGYYYVSMQEDGLPVTNATYGNYGPDYFLRPDATLGRLEAVKGGTASILGANAPGGIFNYIMKEGGNKTAGEVATKYGLEGDGKNNFYRTDFNIGGPLGHNWFWDAGGFYRYDEGNRNPGYAMNRGGQFRSNIVKKYNSGSIKLYAKYLNDHNGWPEFTPTVGFFNPKPAPGFSITSSVLMPSVQQNLPINQTGQIATYNNRDLIHSIDKSFGFNWEQRLGNGFTFNNAMRYSDKAAVWNTNAVVYPVAMDDLVTYAILGLLGTPGTYSIKSMSTGKELANITSFSGFDFNVNHSELPGSDVSANSLFFEPVFYVDNKVKELLDQFSLTKKMKNMSFTFGGFYGHSKIDRLNSFGGVALGTIQDKPELVNITRTNQDGSIAMVTNSNGVTGVAGGGFSLAHAAQSQLALFFGHNWQIAPALNVDWGVRYESMQVKGYNTPSVSNQDTAGGLDGNPLTLYDNAYGTTPATYNFNKTVNTFSYSAGLNYTISNQFSLYGRYSEGNKAPDLDMYFNATSDFLAKTLNPLAQKVRQFELGIKARTGNLNLFVTPFYSVLSNVSGVQNFQNEDQTFYGTPLVYNKYRTYGVEVEADYAFAKHFNVRGVLTLQKSKAVDYHTWLSNGFGPEDDSLVSFSGNEVDNIARSIFNITPSYNLNKFYAQLTWAFMGKRQANVANAFQLPSFSQFNFSTGYDVTKNFKLGLVINNVFNTYGVMSWSRPGTFLAALDRQGFTKEMYNDAVKNNTPYSTVSIPARSYFVTATFRF